MRRVNGTHYGPAMQRVVEPEIMDDPDQVAAYAGADFSDVNQSFVARFVELAGGEISGHIIDLGCGPGILRSGCAVLCPRFT